MGSDVGESRNGILAVSGKHQLPRLWHGPVQIGSPPLPRMHAGMRFAKQGVKWVVKAHAVLGPRIIGIVLKACAGQQN